MRLDQDETIRAIPGDPAQKWKGFSTGELIALHAILTEHPVGGHFIQGQTDEIQLELGHRGMSLERAKREYPF
jgi:hypothetical protein